MPPSIAKNLQEAMSPPEVRIGRSVLITRTSPREPLRVLYFSLRGFRQGARKDEKPGKGGVQASRFDHRHRPNLGLIQRIGQAKSECLWYKNGYDKLFNLMFTRITFTTTSIALWLPTQLCVPRLMCTVRSELLNTQLDR